MLKTLFSVTYKWTKCASVVVTGRAFQSSETLVSKVGPYLGGKHAG